MMSSSPRPQEIMADDWSALADVCIEAASGERPGTVLWALDQLLVLDDERARPLLEQLVASEHGEIRHLASLAVRSLDLQPDRRAS